MTHLWLRLMLTPHIGPAKARLLVEHFGSIKQLFDIVDSHTPCDIPTPLLKDLQNREFSHRAQTTLQWCKNHGVTCLSQEDPTYPQQLLQIRNPPPLLFTLGNLDLLTTPSIGIVGKRDPDSYGVQSTEKLTQELVSLHYTIVSGLAYGVDKCAHETTLANGGATIAIMATGIDTIYPAAHRELARQIQEKGLILTEQPPGVKGEPYRFIQRNRLISGISKAVIVVQAGKKSGSLATARFCLEQGRDLFAVPSSILTDNSSGNNHLLLQGAAPALSGQEIDQYIRGSSTIEQLELPLALKKVVPLPALSPAEEEIYKVIPAQGAISLDDICDTVHKEISDVTATLFSLEMANVIEMSAGNCYQRCY